MGNNKVLKVTSKNLIPHCILRILQEHSDYRHKLTQSQIIQFLKTEYGIDDVERKSIGRNIAHLRDELEVPVESDSKGTWLDEKQFEDYELHVLIDAVMGSRYISKKNSKALIDKLTSLGNEYFQSHVKYTYNLDDLDKTENKAVFYNLSFVEQAVAKNRRLEFDYNRYGTDKALHTTAHHVVTPYRMIVHNQRYYLMALNEKYGHIVYYRIDHITNMNVLWDTVGTPIKTVAGWEGGITNKKLATSLPFMFSDKQCLITLIVAPEAIDYMIDWLGFDIEICEAKEEDGRIRLMAKSSPNAMKYFALQYLDLVEVIEPASLRDDIVKSLKNGINKYMD